MCLHCFLFKLSLAYVLGVLVIGANIILKRSVCRINIHSTLIICFGTGYFCIFTCVVFFFLLSTFVIHPEVAVRCSGTLVFVRKKVADNELQVLTPKVKKAALLFMATRVLPAHLRCQSSIESPSDCRRPAMVLNQWKRFVFIAIRQGARFTQTESCPLHACNRIKQWRLTFDISCMLWK